MVWITHIYNIQYAIHNIQYTIYNIQYTRGTTASLSAAKLASPYDRSTVMADVWISRLRPSIVCTELGGNEIHLCNYQFVFNYLYLYVLKYILFQYIQMWMINTLPVTYMSADVPYTKRVLNMSPHIEL